MDFGKRMVQGRIETNFVLSRPEFRIQKLAVDLVGDHRN